jgi:hypothetical protein
MNSQYNLYKITMKVLEIFLTHTYELNVKNA